MAELEIHRPDGVVQFAELGKERPLAIGSGEGCEVRLTGESAAPLHCTIYWERGRFRLEAFHAVDLNGKAVHERRLAPNDVLRLAGHEMVLRGTDEEFGVDEVVALKVGEEEVDEYYTPFHRSWRFLVGAGGLFALLFVGLILFFVVGARGEQLQFDAAMQDLADGKYIQAVERFDKFLEAYPGGSFEEEAIVWRGIARVRQYTDGSARSWDQAREKLEQLHDEASELDFYRKRRDEILELHLRTAKGYAEQAREEASQDALTLAGDLLRLAERRFPQAEGLDEQSEEVREAMVLAEAAIRRENDRRNTIATVDAAIANSEPLVALTELRHLVQRNPTLRDHESVTDARARTRELERSLVTFAAGGPTAETRTDDPVEAPTTAFVQQQPAESATPSESIVPVPVADMLYGVDDGDGSVAWRTPVGVDAAFPPTSVPRADHLVLVHRPVDDALALLDRKTGRIVRQTALGGATLQWGSRPTLTEDYAYLVLAPGGPAGAGGAVRVLELASGRTVGDYRFPQPLTGSVALDEGRGTLLALGESDSLYTLRPRSRDCETVIESDHEPAGISAAPIMAGRFLFLCENRGPETARLRCLVLSADDGSVVGEPTVEAIRGQVHQTPIVDGGRLFVATNLAGFQAFDLGGENDPVPITPATQAPPRRTEPGPTVYPFAASESEFWLVGREAVRFEIDVRNKTATPKARFELGGGPVLPPRRTGSALIVATIDEQTGRVLVRALDAKSEAEVWRTELGVMPEDVSLTTDADALLILVGSRRHRRAAADLETSELLLEPVVDDGEQRRPAGAAPVPGWEDGVLLWPGFGSQRLWFEPPATGDEADETANQPRWVRLPAATRLEPLLFGTGVLVPGDDGMLYWVDPRKGTELAEPFAAPYSDGRPGSIDGVATLGTGRLAVLVAGRISRLELRDQPFPYFEVTASVDLMTDAEPLLVGLPNDRLFVATGERIVLLQEKELLEGGSWTLDRPAVRGEPIGDRGALFHVGEQSLVAVSVGPPRLAWQVEQPRPPIGRAAIVGPDGASDEAVGLWLAYADGTLREYAWADGTVRTELRTQRELVEGPWALANGRGPVIALGLDGSLVAVRP